MNKEVSIKNNIILSTMYQILKLVVPLITAPYASRVLGVDGIGIYSYTQSYVTYFTLIAALGTETYGMREIARHRDDIQKRSLLFWEIALLGFSTSTVCIIVWGVWTTLNQYYHVYYLVLTFSLLGTMFDISWFYAGLEQFKYPVIQNSVFKILGTLSIFIFVKQSTDLWKYILIMSSSIFLGNLSMWIYVPKFICKISFHDIKILKHLRETFVYFIPTIAISIYTVLDKTLIGLITRDTSENGNYEQATKIINMAKTLSFTGINNVIQSRASYLFRDQKYDEVKKKIALSMDYLFFIGFGLCFGIIAIASRFVPVYFGDGYDKTVQILNVLAPLIIIVGMSNCIGSQYYNPAGLRAKSAKYIIVGSITNLVLNLCLIPHLKSIGAAIATIIAELLITVLYIRNCESFYTWGQSLKQSWKKIAAGLIMMFIVMGIGRLFDLSITGLCIQILVGVAVYIFALIIMRDEAIHFILSSFLHIKRHNKG